MVLRGQMKSHFGKAHQNYVIVAEMLTNIRTTMLQTEK